MVSFPHCKINLGLRIVGKRDDGFHNIETCFYPLSWADVLEIIPAKTMSFTNTGIQVPGHHHENLILRAYYLLQEKYNLSSIAIHLHKTVPMGAGLGGGSSNAAYTLKLLNEVFELKLSIVQLEAFASQLGSDCTFFLHDKPMIGEGRGEILFPINLSLSGKYVVVIKPDIHISTSEAYKNIKPQQQENAIREVIEHQAAPDWKGMLTNDFELHIFKQYPAIEKIKIDLYTNGAHYASMSGSGSSVFGIFESSVDLRKQFNGMIYWSGTL